MPAPFEVKLVSPSQITVNMPVPTRTQPVTTKNIWVAAGDGDLARVQVCSRLSFQ